MIGPKQIQRRRGAAILQQRIRQFAIRTLQGLADAGVFSSLVDLATQAGFSGNDAIVAAAIAMAESSGTPVKYNPEVNAKGGTPPGQGSFGLWQIYLKKHPEFAGWNLLDPQVNAAAAYRVFQQAGGFTPWTTFVSGAFRSYLPAAGSTASSSAVPAPDAPLTIDANTGEVISNAPDISTLPSADTGISTLNTPLLLTGVAVGAYLLTELLRD